MNGYAQFVQSNQFKFMQNTGVKLSHLHLNKRITLMMENYPWKNLLDAR